jgi:hypothetical protein
VFDEAVSWRWDDDAAPDVSFVTCASSSPSVDGSHGAEVHVTRAPSPPDATTPMPPPMVPFATPPSTPNPELYDAAEGVEVPHQFHRVTDLLGLTSVYLNTPRGLGAWWRRKQICVRARP